MHPHCHHRSVVGTGADQRLLEALGYQVTMLDAGCCGLAGSFGFNAAHEPVSRRIGEETWLPKLRSTLSSKRAGDETARLVIDGFSCAMQLENLGSDLVPEMTSIAALLRSHLASD